MFLLDTNTVSKLLRDTHPKLRTAVKSVPISNLSISCIVAAEIRYGVAKNPNLSTAFRSTIESFLNSVTIIPWTDITAQHYAALRQASEAQGITISGFDMLIASQAAEAGLVLITNDSALKRLSPWISVADWTE
jgi:tRNA(fMet)-specific endonuclease VapC